ncbi:MAG TPA: DedA family protein [Solirubrobacteraceae bacterium]|nr:DedA family protein [Solirubrobacteraceae bacterium]
MGYPVLGLLVGLESAGIPLPGETALVAGAALAKHGGLQIEVVIAVAAAAAIIGDSAGYAVSRRYGRKLLTRPGRTQTRRMEVLTRGEAFFDRHGPKAVFFGRWITGLRVWASWLAGITHMPYRQFLMWNALGGITWAITIGLVGYIVGTAAEQIISTAGLGAAIVVGVLVIAAIIYFHIRRRHKDHKPAKQPEPNPEN